MAEFKEAVLSDRAILEAMKHGAIIIIPFHRDQLSNTSYDCTLGRYYYKETPERVMPYF